MTQDAELWKLAPPGPEAPAETSGLNKEEADFVSKYLALADQLLQPPSAETPTTINEKVAPGESPPKESSPGDQAA